MDVHTNALWYHTFWQVTFSKRQLVCYTYIFLLLLPISIFCGKGRNRDSSLFCLNNGLLTYFYQYVCLFLCHWHIAASPPWSTGSLLPHHHEVLAHCCLTTMKHWLIAASPPWDIGLLLSHHMRHWLIAASILNKHWIKYKALAQQHHTRSLHTVDNYKIFRVRIKKYKMLSLVTLV